MNAIDLRTGDLVQARGREWIVLGLPEEGLIRVRPLSGSEEDAQLELALERSRTTAVECCARSTPTTWRC